MIKYELPKASRKRIKPYFICDDTYSTKDSSIETNCHLITSHSTDKDGYVVFYHKNKYIKAHRYIYEKHVEPIIEGNLILHKCGNPNCINPLHLKQGTDKENAEDRNTHGTFHTLCGEKNGMSKLNAHQINEIRSLISIGDLKQTEIAKMYNVNQTHISRIKNGLTWEK